MQAKYKNIELKIDNVTKIWCKYIDTVATGSSDYVDIGFCSGYNTSFGGTYICISISWQGYAIQFRMGQGASTVKTRCTNTSKQWTAWH